MPTQSSATSPNIIRIELPLGARSMAVHALVGERVWLVDTGVAETPEAHLLPALAERGITPADIAGVIVTHCDSDHCGGNAALRRHCPQATFVAHQADAVLMQAPDRCLRERYAFDRYGPVLPADVRDRVRAALGEPCRIDVHLADCGCELVIGPEERHRPMRVLHAPGHTAGHVVVYDSATQTLVLTDAVLSSFIPDARGRPLFGPTYRHLQPYLNTIAMIERLAPERLLPTHFPVVEGREAVAAFLAESRAFAERITRRVREVAQPADDLLAVVDRLLPEAGDWVDPANPMVRYSLCYPVAAAVEHHDIRLAEPRPAKEEA